MDGDSRRPWESSRRRGGGVTFGVGDVTEPGRDLGDVVNALTTGAKHIPYRNHKLTTLMSDSIGGNAKTLMFVNLSPADYNAEESHSSLLYAERVKKVKNSSAKTVETQEIKALKDQLAKLKKLQAGKKKG